MIPTFLKGQLAETFQFGISTDVDSKVKAPGTIRGNDYPITKLLGCGKLFYCYGQQATHYQTEKINPTYHNTKLYFV